VTPTESADTVQRATVDDSKPLPLRSLLIPRVIIAAGNYAALSFFDIAFRAVQPLFFATPLELGGLGLDPPRIGNILAFYGIINGLFQIFFFANLHDRFGSKIIYSASMATAVPMVITLPILNAVARTQGFGLIVWSIVGLQLSLSVMFNLAYCQFPHYVSSLCVDLNLTQLAYSFILRQRLRTKLLLVQRMGWLSWASRSFERSALRPPPPRSRYPSRTHIMHGWSTII
jgi:hypothetical protein